MSYYEKFYKNLPEDEGSFPPYLFNMLDDLKSADSEIATLVSEKADLEINLKELKGKLTEAQEENIRLLSETEKTVEEVEEIVDEILDINELTDGLESGEIEII